MATEAVRLERKESTGRKEKKRKREKEKKTLDSYRPSHGRHCELALRMRAHPHHKAET
jgi:hypothetical protein